MAASNYAESIKRVLKWEGGYVNHPADPGGPTNFGITLAVYKANGHPNATAADIRAMKIEEAGMIYRLKYAKPIAFDQHKMGVDYSLLDYAVHSGTGRANKVIRRVCGLPDNAPFADLMTAINKRDPKKVVAAINSERLRFLQSLSTWGTFGKGWGRRMQDVSAAALAMAANQPAHPPVPDTSTGKGEAPKPKTTAPIVAGGGGTATGGGFSFGEFISAHPVYSALIFIGAVIVIVAVAEYVAHRVQKSRQEAVIPIDPVPEER